MQCWPHKPGTLPFGIASTSFRNKGGSQRLTLPRVLKELGFVWTLAKLSSLSLGNCNPLCFLILYFHLESFQNSWVEVSWCHQISPFANSPGTPGLQTLFPVGPWVMSSLRFYPEDTDLPPRIMYQHILTCFSQTSVWNHLTWLYIRSLSLFKTSFILTYFVEGCRHTIAWVWKLEDNLKELVLSFHDGFLTSNSGQRLSIKCRYWWRHLPGLRSLSFFSCMDTSSHCFLEQLKWVGGKNYYDKE